MSTKPSAEYRSSFISPGHEKTSKTQKQSDLISCGANVLCMMKCSIILDGEICLFFDSCVIIDTFIGKMLQRSKFSEAKWQILMFRSFGTVHNMLKSSKSCRSN